MPTTHWQQQGGTAPDPLAGRHGQPILSTGSPRPGASYVGRVVVELWERANADDAPQLAFTADATNGDHATLLERVAVALPHRAAAAVPDPLGPQPIVSIGGPGASYVGRLIAELWEVPGSAGAPLLTYSVAAAGGDGPSVAGRIATALPIRLATVNNGRPFQP